MDTPSIVSDPASGPDASSPSTRSTRSTNRLGRTALLILLLEVLVVAAFIAVAYVFNKSDLEVAVVFGGVGFAIFCGASLWTMTLAIRALRAGEALLCPVLVLLGIGVLISVPLSASWAMPDRGSRDILFIHALALPVLIPTWVFAALLAAPFAFRFARGKSSRPGRTFARNFLLLTLLFFLPLFPFVFYAYGGSMARKWAITDAHIGDNPKVSHWTEKAVARMPRAMGDAVFAAMPFTRIRSDLTRRGYRSFESLIVGAEAGTGANYVEGLFAGYGDRLLDAARRFKRGEPNIYGPIVNSILGEYSAKFLPSSEAEQWLADVSQMPVEFQIGFAYGSLDRTDKPVDVAEKLLDSPHPAVWRYATQTYRLADPERAMNNATRRFLNPSSRIRALDEFAWFLQYSVIIPDGGIEANKAALKAFDENFNAAQKIEFLTALADSPCVEFTGKFLNRLLDSSEPAIRRHAARCLLHAVLSTTRTDPNAKAFSAALAGNQPLNPADETRLAKLIDLIRDSLDKTNQLRAVQHGELFDSPAQ